MAVMRVALLMAAVAFAGLALAQDDPLAWIDQHKVRAAYHYGRPPVAERVTNLKRVGINAMILKAPIEKALPWAQEARKQGLKCFFACNFNVDAEEHALRAAVLHDGITEAFATELRETTHAVNPKFLLLGELTVRGLEKVRMHVGIALLVMLAGAWAMVARGKV